MRALAAFVLALVALSSAPAFADPAALYAVPRYDARRDPYRDVELAVERAEAEHRVVLLELGGDWCGWCQVLDRFIAEHPVVRAEMTQSFLIVKVNVSRTNSNREFLSTFPEPDGYPALIVLDDRGAFAGSQSTSDFEQGRSYNAERMIAFARRWRERPL